MCRFIHSVNKQTP